MSNQTLVVVFIIVGAIAVSAFLFMKKAVSAEEKNRQLSKELNDSEAENATLKQQQLSLPRLHIRQF